MTNIVAIHQGKTPTRVHFIVEWADKFGLKQSDIVKEIGADKGLVSRWFKGTMPKQEYLERLAALFQMEGDISRLFRHPDDDWLLRLFADKSKEEKDHAIRILKAALNA